VRIARRVRDVLDGNYAAPVSGDDLAAAAGCSRYAAYRAFRSVAGLAPGEYQRQLRLRAARQALARGTPAGQAAADAGFADQAHLTRWFRRCYGITPPRTREPPKVSMITVKICRIAPRIDRGHE
jgi:AraC-like DNA-binding protein